MRKINNRRILILILGVGLFSFLLLFGIITARASQSGNSYAKVENSSCLYCHGKPGLVVTLPDTSQLYLTIDPQHFSDSVHKNLSCTDCHADMTKYPHPHLNANNRRDVTLHFYTSCKKCHEEQYLNTLDSVHEHALAAGNNNAAVCTDCHNPHTQTQLTDNSGKLLPEARLKIPQICARCHSTIYDEYKQSVHGAALTELGNLDVPTCIDCHGVHNIADPTTTAFKLHSPEICSKCHTNPTLMGKYGISTNVLNTYIADFHGTTVTLFEKMSPDQATNKPVCFDCHGVHDIKKVDDPVYGLEMKQNLLKACQRCHPTADLNFPTAWMSHYIPSPSHYSVVYYVNIFYKIFIPTVIGSMVIFVVSDIIRRMIERRKGVNKND